MGVDFGDLNRDGFVDFMTVDMLSRFHTNRQMQLAGMAPVRRLPGRFGDREQVQRNCLQLGRGDGTFAEVAWQAGVVASEWSWGPILLDVDLDGFEDILVPNGQWRDFQNSDGAERLQAAQRGGKVLSSTDIAELVRSFPKFATPSVAFRNRTGERLGFVPEFEEVGAAWGFTQPGVSQGAALADLDGDGDLDVVMNRLMDAPALYRNEAAGGRIELRLAGSGANPHGLGAVATLRDMSGTAPPRSLPVQRVEFIGGGRYLSGDEAVRTFAAREDANYELKVVWPSGRTTVCSGIKSGRLYEVNEPVSGPIQSSPIQPMPAFIDCSAVLGHRHVDDDFEDTARQPLMPRRLSQLGPGVTWADINGDGHDDLLIGTGKGGQLAVFQGDGRGGFQRLTHAPFNRTQGRDLTGLLALNPGLIFAGAANYEDGTTNGGCIAILDLIGQRTGTSLSGQRSSVGPLAAADLTGDGELQVFVGGRVIPERYPEPATSLLLSTKGGRLAILQRFENLGLVSGACFTDLQGDGRPELVLALEWGPLKIFRTAEGQLVPWDPWVLEIATNSPSSRLLSTYTGFWNSVTAGDFDGDGRLDIVAGNWGRNTQAGHAPDLSAAMVPARMWYGDLSGTGTFDLFETGFRNGIEVPARELPALRGLFPAQAERVPTFSAYARSSMPELFGNLLENARRVDANCLDSVLLLNRGDHFELRRLPDEVQLAPVFGLAVGDADGDGNEDLWVAQGFFATDPMFNRADAGRGVWLYGDGHGGFRADLRSGIAVYGEARGAALADFDEDGRVDLCVAQNGAATTLWRNVGAKPGLRVRLEGPPGNSTAAGAAVRLWVDDRPGPWRERHAGAGYWSCDSPVLVLGSATPPTAAEVRWPGGKTQRYPVGSDTRELKVRPD